MAIVPYSAANPFADALKLPERLFAVSGVDVVIKQRWKADGRGGSSLGFGASVYESALVLADWLLSDVGVHLTRHARILELGAGLGLTAIALALAGTPSSVFCTDGDDDLVRQAHDNAVANSAFACDMTKWPCSRDHEAATAATSAGQLPSPMRFARLLWGTRDVAEVLRQARHLPAPPLPLAVGSAARCSSEVAVQCSACGRHEPFTFRLIVAADVVACPYQSALAGLQRTLRRLLTQCHYCAGAVRLVPPAGAASASASACGDADACRDDIDAFPVAVIAYKRRHGSEAAFFHGEAAHACASGSVARGSGIADAVPTVDGGAPLSAGRDAAAGLSSDCTGADGPDEATRMLRGGVAEFAVIEEVPREQLHPDFRALPMPPLQPIQIFRLRVRRDLVS